MNDHEGSATWIIDVPVHQLPVHFDAFIPDNLKVQPSHPATVLHSVYLIISMLTLWLTTWAYLMSVIYLSTYPQVYPFIKLHIQSMFSIQLTMQTYLSTYRPVYIYIYPTIYPFIMLHIHFDAFFLVNSLDLPIYSPPSLERYFYLSGLVCGQMGRKSHNCANMFAASSEK